MVPVRFAIVGMTAAAGMAAAAAADTATISCKRDVTIHETPGVANGAGEFFFVGRNSSGGERRRALLMFDVASAIPAGSTVTSVQLKLHLSRTSTGNQTISVYRLTSDWGEGTSNPDGNEGAGANATPGEATWETKFWPSVMWTTPGSDKVVTASASRSIASTIASYTWSSTAMLVADVQGWLANPATNFGWVLIGNEATTHTAKRFDSRENPTESFRPQLIVVYTPPAPPCPADRDGNGLIEPADVSVFVTDWNNSLIAGNLAADFDGNGAVQPADIAVFVTTWLAALSGGC
ncbi:MAG: DNRLRE domain-containing protein [Phycisphaeraceae bacterium]|nr:DNRLRE domain-containing protein [Phycisphaeraceae bacterium]